MAKSIRHGAPSKAYRASLRKPKQGDYLKLVEAAIQAVLEGEENVYVAFSYLTKFPRDFPKGILILRDGYTNVFKIKARKLLKWLGANGHTDITGETLDSQMTSFRKRIEWWDRRIE